MTTRRETFDIDGDKFEFCTLPVSKSMEVYVELIKQLGEGVANALASKTDKFDLAELANTDILSLLPGGMSYLVERLDAGVMTRICKALLTGGLVNGTPILDGKDEEGMEMFESHFSGRMVHFINVFWKAVSFNFGPFSGAKR